MEPDLVRPLTAKERVCLDCRLPDCDETSEACLWRERKRPRSRWADLRARVDLMQPGDVVVVQFDTREEASMARQLTNARAKRLGQPIASRSRVNDGEFILTVRRTDA